MKTAMSGAVAWSVCLGCVLWLGSRPASAAEGPGAAKAAAAKPGAAKPDPTKPDARPPTPPSEELRKELKNVPYKIVYETHRDGNWELYRINADGSEPKNLTCTAKIDEMYPHVSPSGQQVCFTVDEGRGQAKVRNLYVMNMDGAGRKLVGKSLREPCWDPAGTSVVCCKAEFEKFTLTDYATKGILIVDPATSARREHCNAEIHHLYNICCTADGKWYIATVHAGMGYGHAILAIEAQGKKVFDLKIPGCRPDVSHDGKRIAWGCDDFTLRAGDLDFSGLEPKVINQRNVVESAKPIETYHIDWSPDGKYVAYSRGPSRKKLGPAPEMIGAEAEGWDICVADATKTNRWVAVTTDGKSNKEPDWVPAAK